MKNSLNLVVFILCQITSTRKRTVVTLCTMFCLVAGVVNAQQKGVWDYPGRPGLWDYPVKPGTEEWKQFKTYDEKLRACQIPEELLYSLSTEDLMDLCLRYPSLSDFFAFNNTNAGLDKLFSDFNGIRELYKRKDVSSNLTKRYMEKIQSLSFLNDNKNSDLEKGFFLITVSVMEVLLSRIEWKDSEGEESPKDVLRALVAGYEEKCIYPDWFKGSGFKMNFFSRAHVISKMEPSFVERLPQREKSGVLYSGMADEQSILLIDELSYQLIK